MSSYMLYINKWLYSFIITVIAYVKRIIIKCNIHNYKLVLYTYIFNLEKFVTNKQ